MNSTDKLCEIVLKAIRTHRLIEIDEKVLVAVSGGADSVALLHILKRIGFNCDAVHCNFHLRGEESDRDENFVRALCQKMNVRLHTTNFNTVQYAKEQGVSIEMAARDLRYEFFDKLRCEFGYDKIAVAHHRDDNVETLLLNLIRGTGLKGLKGMRYCNGYVVRPLLDVSRQCIEEYLTEVGMEFVTDSTNLETDAIRNKIRLEVLPLLRTINPSISDTLQETIARLNECYDLYSYAVESIKKGLIDNTRISIESLKRTPSARTILYEILSEYGFNNSQTDDIIKHLDGETGKIYESGEWRLLRNRDALVLKNKSDRCVLECDVLPLDGYVRVTNNVAFVVERRSVAADFVVPRRQDILCMDLDKVSYPITVRLVEEGDKFIPFGMDGEKLVSDYLTDRKKSIFEKECQLVVCTGNKIAWLVNERSDNRFRVTDKTKRVLVVKCINT